ncbi:hypothetical protein [uncultured Clostridium sp.]|uniref:hypothetical protein n=1 Tax=uncultured Clostridium sp. TaxID=59620 RepID=UPI0025D6FA53|nr:hypothetical protein [uncultured Clostridium sp.]
MKYMYIKYKNNIKTSLIKEDNKIICNFDTIKSFKKASDLNSHINNSHIKKAACKVLDMNKYVNNKNNIIDEEITQFFFNSIHKNYLKNR